MHDEFFKTGSIEATPGTTLPNGILEGSTQIPESIHDLLSGITNDTSFIAETTIMAQGMQMVFSNPSMLTEINSFQKFKEYITKHSGFNTELLEKINNFSEERFAEQFGKVLDTLNSLVNAWKLPITLPVSDEVDVFRPCCEENSVENDELHIRQFLGNKQRDFIVIQHNPNSTNLSFELHHIGTPFKHVHSISSDSFINFYSTEGIEEIDKTLEQIRTIENACLATIAHLLKVKQLYREKENLIPEE